MGTDNNTNNKRTILTQLISIESTKTSLDIPIIKPQDKGYSLDSNDSLSMCLAYLDKTHSRNKWKYLNEFANEKSKYIKIDYKKALNALIEKLYGKLNKYEYSPHLLILNKFEYIESEQKFKLEYDTTNQFNLHDILLYSPKAIDSYEKILFIFYQLLKLVKHLHSINLNCGELKLSDIYIDQNYWIRVKLPLENILDLYQSSNNDETFTNEDEEDDDENEIINGERIGYFIIKEKLGSIYDSYKHLTFKELANITKNWCNNKISNFHYLLIINCIAGRKLDCPYNHPIFPWISDFTSINTNLRDLTLSKFRLNKGDAHLDLIYQASGGSNSNSSYHLTEFLSEITYFVYKSRVTSKEVLCNNVRRTWVPNEYPFSISRLYIWTPEECIPEFFCEPDIFRTIHDDLPDLKVPDWCNGSVEEFVRTHRLLLDSDLVSKKLHHWIDLVFGYKLNGEAAVEAKNVCLPLIDNHQTLKPNGIVQLFTAPHPYRVEKTYNSDKAPKIVNKYRTNNQAYTNSSSASFSSSLQDSDFFRKKTIIANTQDGLINLPDDYNPFGLIDQIENLLRFTNKAYNALPDTTNKEKSTYQKIQDLTSRDLKCLTCVLTELVLFHKLKCLPQQNNIQVRHLFICKTIIKEPHIMSGPFMQIISNVLKPFSDLTNNMKQLSNQNASTSASAAKKSKLNGMPIYFENMNKYQSDFVNIDTLLNMHLTILPFKPYFETLYSFCEIFAKIDYLINEFDYLKENNLKKQLNILIEQTGSLTDNSLLSRMTSKAVPKFEVNSPDNSNSSEKADNSLSQDQFKLDSLYEQKFYLGLLHIPSLMFDISDPKKNQLSQSICATNDLFELILPYILNLFKNPNTCINSLLYLFEKIARFFSQAELTKKFLPIILQVLNVVDLKETLGIDLLREDDKYKFCNLFEFNFINQLRIIFGMNVFLTEICPFLIEAISGFKDFVSESLPDEMVSTPNISRLSMETPSTSNNTKSKISTLNNKKAVLDQLSGVFDMENINNNNNLNNINQIEELDEKNQENIYESTSNRIETTTPKKIIPIVGREGTDSTATSPQSLEKSVDLNTKSFIDYKKMNEKSFESDRASISSNSSNINNINNVNPPNKPADKQLIKISETAFRTFTRIIGSLGPVLTCKYCCNDLIKMLGICYMNNKSLFPIENSNNPLNSIRPIEGDRYANMILEALKTVAMYYGEQVIVLQYLTHVSNTVNACNNRITIRLESSLLAGVVLVYYFLSYLDIKLLMDNLNYILNYIVMPIIKIYTNNKIKFPSGHLVRQVLAYKILDIVLIISLRIGPEQTRIELEHILVAYFNGFNLVRSKIMNKENSSVLTTNTVSTSVESQPKLSSSFSRPGGFFKNRFFGNRSNQAAVQSNSTQPIAAQTKDNKSIKIEKENLEELDSFDGYLKYSYDQSTNEFIGSSFKTNNMNEMNSNISANNGINSNNINRFSTLGSLVASSRRFRSQSFGLLRMNNDDQQSNMEIEDELKNLNKSDNNTSNNNDKIEIKTNDTNTEDDEIFNTFTSELAHVSYMSISRLNSGSYIDSILSNSDLINRMCTIDENANTQQPKNLSIPKITFSGKPLQLSQSASKLPRKGDTISSSIGINRFEPKSAKNIYSTSYGSSFSENVGIIGNQIQIIQEDVHATNINDLNTQNDLAFDYSPNTGSRNKFVLKFTEQSLREAKSKIDTTRHLSDNWVAYWENAIRTSDKKSSLFDFKQIDLLTLSGHTSAVKSIYPLDNESSIISCSKDKTVKLWSLKNHGVSSSGQKKNIQNCQWTYNQHKKSVFSVLFIESMRVCASCDGSIHIWNPFIGKKLFQLDSQAITSMTTLTAPSASFVVSTSDNLIKFVDLRSKNYAHELRTCYAPSGSIKSISASDNLLLVGYSTGLMFLIDMRTGWIQESWKNLDSKILQVKFFSNDRFLSTYNDGSILISSIKEKVQLQNMIKVYNEPVPYVSTTENQIITGTNSNKIGIHSYVDDKPNQLNFSVDKLKPDNFKGIISSLNYLPLNRILIIGSDNGEIKQFC